MKRSVKERILQLQIENAAIKQKMSADAVKSSQEKSFYVTFDTPINELKVNLKQKH